MIFSEKRKATQSSAGQMVDIKQMLASVCIFTLIISIHSFASANSAPNHLGTYQAEDAFYHNAEIRGEFFSQGSGWNGTAAIDLKNGGYIRWTIEVPAKGNYDIKIKTTGAANNMSCQVKVNNSVIKTNLPIPNTGSWWKNWTFVTMENVLLNEGNNTFQLRDVGHQQPNFDQIEVLGVLDFRVDSTKFTENLPPNTTVSTITAFTFGSGTSLNYSFSNGEGSDDNHLFSIDESTGHITNLFPLDYESNKSSYSVRIQGKNENNSIIQKIIPLQLIDIFEDLDGDGVEDHNDEDQDGDGFSDTVEIGYGSNPRDANSVANVAPSSLILTSTTFQENMPVGTFIGKLNATDPDTNAILSIYMTTGSGSDNNALFQIDANNILKTKHIYDFESLPHLYSIRVKVEDEHGFTLEKVFPLNLLNEIEDLDGDGVEDFYDTDDDGDGFSDSVENAYGSNPRDKQSVANAYPDSISISNNSIAENRPVGTVVGSISATDPDNGSVISLLLVEGEGSSANSLFEINDGKIVSKKSFDYETDQTSFPIHIRVNDEHNFSLEKAFAISLVNIVEDLDGDGIEDYYDQDDDGDGFTDIDEINFGSDPMDSTSMINQVPTALFLNGTHVVENAPLGTVVGKMLGVDPDVDDILTYTLVTGEGSSSNSLFQLSSEGILSTKQKFDHEKSAFHSIRVRVEDHFGAGLEKQFSLNVGNLYVPLAVTHTHKKNEGAILLSGEILDNGGELPFEVGIQISTSLDFAGGYELLINQTGSDRFMVNFNDRELGENYYYRAFARNSEGTAYGATLTLFQPKPGWWLNIGETSKTGWITDSWMGNLVPYPNQWAYHRQLGWIYMSPDGNDGYWLWRQKNGWLWTNSDSWPFLWSHQSAGWLYLFPSNQRTIFYDYSNRTVK